MPEPKDSGIPKRGLTSIGPGLVLVGDLVSEENIRLRGQVEGNISTSGSLHVEVMGVVKGDIVAESVVVEGSIEGSVIAAEKFDLRSSGRILGNVRASVVAIADHAFLRGRILATERIASNHPQLMRRLEKK